MKKIWMAFAAFIVTAFAVSCEEENPQTPEPEVITKVSGVVINEVYTFSNQSEADDLDWIELYNTTNEDIDLSGVLMWESGGQEEAWPFPKGSVIPAKGHIVVDSDKYGLMNDPIHHPAWGLSKGPDEFIVLANSDYKVIDEIALPSLNEHETYGRITDGAAEWQIFQKGTKGKKNEGDARVEFENVSGLFINEVYHDNSDVFVGSGWDASVDFIELYNATDADIDISGYEIYDDTESDEKKYVVPAGTVVPAKGFLTYDVFKENPSGPSFGLGAGGDWVFIYKSGKSELVDKIEVPGFSKESGLRDNGYTYGRKPDGSSALVLFTQATKNASNNDAPVLEGWEAEPEEPETPDNPETPVVPSTPEPIVYSGVILNELCGNKAYNGSKFIELRNTSAEDVNLAGWTIRKYAADATDVEGKYNICWTAPSGMTLAAGAHLVLAADQEDPAVGFNAGLSAKKGVKFELVNASAQVADRFVRGEDTDPFGEESLSENGEASYSRVPDGTGDWAYAVPTPGEVNGEKTGDIEGLVSFPNPTPVPLPEQSTTVCFNELSGNKFYEDSKYIELYNNGTEEADITGWTIRKYAADATYVAGKYDICWTAPNGTKLAADAYLVLKSDQEDPSVGFNAGLSAKKELKFELVNASGQVVDKFLRGKDVDPFEENKLIENSDCSFSRVPNGYGEWAYAAPTPGEANGAKVADIEHE